MPSETLAQATLTGPELVVLALVAAALAAVVGIISIMWRKL
jgi:hypothetical protein